MEPARYDIRVYRGAPWSRTVRRIDRSTKEPLPVATPARLVVRRVSRFGGTIPTPVVTLTATSAEEGFALVFTLTGEQTAALDLGSYRHITTVSTVDEQTETVVLEGDFTVLPGVIS